MPATRTIVIAGAGIGGLTAALALAARGFSVIILERADRLEEAGAGLQLSPNASRVLIDLGLRDALAARAVTPDNIRIMSTASGEVIRLPLGDAASGRAGAPYWVIHRADLQAALLAQVQATPAIELRLGCRFEALTANGGRAGIRTVSGAETFHTAADALIGADGVWSTVRQQICPAIQPGISRRIAWRGTLDAAQVSPRHIRDVQLWMGPNAHVVAYPMSGGDRVNVVAIITGDWSEPGWSAPGDPREIASPFAGRWPGGLPDMIRAVPEWRRWALFTMPDGGVWSPNTQQPMPVALLGDAAHAMLPFAAQGAGMAIEDAAVLADCVGAPSGDPSALAAALGRYQALRQPRVLRVQRTARQSGRIYHLGGPVALARDLSMRLLGARRLQARQDWIYDWKA